MNVAIIGGGIGGLTAAVALAQRGIEARVFERAPELRAVGAGIWLPPNAMTVLERLGLAGSLRAAGRPLERVEVWSGRSRLSVLDLSRVEKELGHTIVSIRRSELQRVLAEQVGPRLILDRRCTGIDLGASRPRARFERGDAVEADLVIGADGVDSEVREAVAPAEPIYSGQVCYRGLSDLRLPSELARTCREVWGGRARFGFSPVDERTVYWFAPITAPPNGRDDAPTATLERAFAEFPEPVPEILSAADSSSITRLDLRDLPSLPRWHRDRAVLIGDAAHAPTPNLGQGGAQAIEDAWILARELGSGGEIEACLQRYEQARRGRAEGITRTARRFGALAHVENGLLRGLRDLMLRAGSSLGQSETLRLYRAPE
jgi:2-polyprenyl-6-methoxyphenol hydroxylase-like FAD-dependent oxidoreductase